MKCQVGDKLRVPGFLGALHYGIYVGRTQGMLHGVVHNAKGHGVVLSEFREFAAGRPVVIETRVAGGWRAEQVVARRALALVGKEYDLLNFNCEHAATLAQTGRARSPQVEAFTLLVLVALGVAVLSEA